MATMVGVEHNTTGRAAASPNGVRRRGRRLCVGVLKRVQPQRTLVIRFDDDLKIGVRAGDRLGRAVYVDGYSDGAHARLLHRFLRPGMVYFDIGAHFGQFTLVAAGCVGSGGQVHAFEAAGQTYTQLKANIELNHLTNVTANHAAVFDKPGQIELQVCVPGKGEFNAIGKPLRPEREVVGTETVPAVTVDDYCGEHNIERVDLMKIDTNGAELSVLRGAQQLLAGDDAPVIVCEFNDVTVADMGYCTADLRAELERQGYGLHRLDEATDRLAPEPQRDYPKTVDVIAAKDANRFDQLIHNGTS